LATEITRVKGEQCRKHSSSFLD